MKITKEKLDEPKYTYILHLSERELREVIRTLHEGIGPMSSAPLSLRELYK